MAMAAMVDMMPEPQGTGETVIMDVLKTVTIKPHQATDDTQLDLKVNDIVYVLEQDETGWWGGHKEGEETTGWFPGSCVRPIFEPGTLGHQAGVVQEEQVWQQEGTQQLSSPCLPEKGSRPTNPALETENRSPVRRSLLVASPQRGNHDSLRAGGSNVAIPGTPAEPSNKEAAGTQATAADLGTEVLVSENSKLKHENAELADTIKMMKRQSDVDRRNCTEMEAAAERERQRREEVERRLQTLQAESSEKDSVMSEATTLRKQLEKERQDAKAHAEALKHMEMLYKSQLEEKEEELRRASEHLESHRRSVQSEKQRARSLEEQLHGLREQYESCVQRTEAVDQGKPRRLSPPVAVTDETRRRLFSSTASNGGGTARTPASGDRAGQYFDSFPAPPPPTATQVGSPTAEATRGRALTTAARSQPAPAPAMVGQFQQQQHQQQQQQQQQASGVPGSARSATVGHRPPEPPRAASSAPRAGCRSGVSPSRLGHARSTGDLEQRQRAASVDPCLEDAPPRGCVADKVTMFEQRCQTPRRDGSEVPRVRTVPRSEPHDIRPGRISREDRAARATPPALPRQNPVPALVGLAPLMPQAAAQTMPAISVTPPVQAGAGAPAASSQGFLSMPAATTSSSIQAMTAQYQSRLAPPQETVLNGRAGVRAPPRGLELSADDEDDESAAEQVDMGMSPICRPQPRDDAPVQPPAVYTQHEQHEPVAVAGRTQALSVPVVHQATAALDVRAAGAPAATAASSSTAARVQAAQSRESNVPEVSVLERIRKLEVR